MMGERKNEKINIFDYVRIIINDKSYSMEL